MKRNIFIFIAVLLTAGLLSAGTSQAFPHMDNLYFSYNPKNTLDRSIYGFTFETPSPALLASNDITNIKYASADSNQTIVLDSNPDGTMNAVITNGRGQSVLSVYAKILSPHSFTLTLTGSNLVPSKKPSESTKYFPVTYRLGPLDYDNPEGTKAKIEVEPKTVGTGAANEVKEEIYSVTIPVLGKDRSSLGYWFCGPLGISSEKITFDKRGTWNGSITMTLAIN